MLYSTQAFAITVRSLMTSLALAGQSSKVVRTFAACLARAPSRSMRAIEVFPALRCSAWTADSVAGRRNGSAGRRGPENPRVLERRGTNPREAEGITIYGGRTQ